MPLIDRTSLDTAAVFPQCLDNQFVPFTDFHAIVSAGLSYKDQRIAEQRQRQTIMEINRSLVYGQQVCINRASLPNCKPLYELYLPEFVDEDGMKRPNPRYEIDEIGHLFKTQALVPHLFKGTTIAGDGTFSLDHEGQRALSHLLIKHESDISFLTLGSTDAEVKKNVAIISLAFESQVKHLASVVSDPVLLPLLLAEVLPSANLVESSDAVGYLLDTLYTIEDMATECSKSRRPMLREAIATDEGFFKGDDYLLRENIYSSLFVRSCTCGKGLASKDCICVSDGRFHRVASESEAGVVFCAKALVDLVYAANVPDTLWRYLLTPWQLPTRNALQDYGRPEVSQAATIDDVARETFEMSRRLYAAAAPALFLPMLEDLRLADICRIRELKQWEKFMEAQEGLLLNPKSGARTFEDFQSRFSDLQEAISQYWTARQFEGARGKPYRSFVSAAFQIGKYVAQWGVRKSGTFDPGTVFMLDRIIDYVAEEIRDRVTVGPAKLLFELIDPETTRWMPVGVGA